MSSQSLENLFGKSRIILTFALVAAALVPGSGCGSSAPAGKFNVSVAAGSLNAALDATPDPTGQSIYFVASGTTGQGVFQVSASGGAVTSLLLGAPLVAPRGIVVSSDGKTLYVADPMAAGGGTIFSLAATGGAANPVPVAAASGTAPRALDLVSEAGADVLYAVGKATDGSPAVQRIAIGGSATQVLKGAPLVSPDGVAATKSGVLYISDAMAGSGASGAIVAIQGGTGTVIAQGLHLGAPAGVALPLAEDVLLVSALDGSGASEVLLLDTATHGTSTFNSVIAQSHDSGGVHRAHQVDIFAWAGTAAARMGEVGTGTVFVIK